MQVLEKGQRFKDFDEFAEAVNVYGLATNAVFTTLDSKRNGPNQYLKLACKHYGKSRSRSKGIRPLQKSFKTDCPVYVYAKRKEGFVIITQLELKHNNHDCNPDTIQQYPERRRLSNDEKKVVETLVSCNIKTATIQSEVRKLTGKSINTQDLANLRYALRVGNRRELEEAIAVLVEILENDADAVVILSTRSGDNLEENLNLVDLRSLIGDNEAISCEIVHQARGVLMFLFIQLGCMRKTFAQYPEVLLMDNSYNVTETRMPLNLCMVMDDYGCGRVISYTFLGNEVQNNMAAVLRCLKQANPHSCRQIKAALIDKDSSERAAIEEELPDVTVQICIFHVLNSMKEHTKEINGPELRENVCKTVQNIVYAKSEEEYCKLREELEKMAPKEFYEYFLSNWDSTREAWAFDERLFVPNYGNNRVEKNNIHLKEILKSTNSLGESIRRILLCHQNKEQSVAFHNYQSSVKQSYVVGSSDPDVRLIASKCTPFAAKLMMAQIRLMEGPHKYTANGSTCDCVFFKSLHLPCRHIFLDRTQKGEPKFRAEEIPHRWLNMSSYQDALQDVGSQIPLGVIESPGTPARKSYKTKYTEAYDVAKDICFILSRSGMAQFNSGLQSLKELRDFLLAGDDVVMAQVNMRLNDPDPDAGIEELTGRSIPIPDPILKTQKTSVVGSESSGVMAATSALTAAASAHGLPGINCYCGELVARRTVTRGSKKGAQFLACARTESKCSFMKYVTESSTENAPHPKQGQSSKKELNLQRKKTSRAKRELTDNKGEDGAAEPDQSKLGASEQSGGQFSKEKPSSQGKMMSRAKLGVTKKSLVKGNVSGKQKGLGLAAVKRSEGYSGVIKMEQQFEMDGEQNDDINFDDIFPNGTSNLEENSGIDVNGEVGTTEELSSPQKSEENREAEGDVMILIKTEPSTEIDYSGSISMEKQFDMDDEQNDDVFPDSTSSLTKKRKVEFVTQCLCPAPKRRVATEESATAPAKSAETEAPNVKFTTEVAPYTEVIQDRPSSVASDCVIELVHGAATSCTLLSH